MPAGRTTNDKSKLFDKFKLAALKGWSGIYNLENCECIWIEINRESSIDAHHMLISERMDIWSKSYGHPIEWNYHFLKTNMDNITSFRPNPGADIAIYQTKESCS